MSNLFTISDIPEWDGFGWSVSWPGRGAVRRQRYKLLEFASQSGDFRVGVCTEKQCLSIEVSLLWAQSWEPEMLDHLFGPIQELTGLAFTERRYAERFVELAERHIAWNLLKRGTEEHN